jgi:hypothetical protein
MEFAPVFNEKAFGWRKRALEKLVEADDPRRLAKFLEKFPKAVEWEQVFGPNHQTFIHLAVQHKKLGAARVLLEHGAKVDTLAIGGGTLLAHALCIGYADQPLAGPADYAFADLLFAHGAKIDQGDSRDYSALYNAAKMGQPDVVKYLLDKGADPDRTPKDDQMTALMHVVQHETWGGPPPGMDMVHLLLAATKDIDRQNKFGMTALYFCNSVAAAQALIESGADPEHKDKKGRFVWDVEGNHRDMPAPAYVSRVAEAREALRQKAALERQIEDSLKPVPLPKSKPLVLKKTP